jgi:hypothetical protein
MSPMANKFRLVLAGVLAMSVATGCASNTGLITSLEDLSTESRREGFVKVPQYRVVSVPGLLPFADVGGLYFYKAKRQPASAIGLSPGQSFILVNEYASQCDNACLVSIRDALSELRANAFDLIRKKIELSRQLIADQTISANTGQHTGDNTQDYNNMRNNFNKSYESVVKRLNKNGVMIYRWSTSSQTGGTLRLVSLFGASGSSSTQYNGYALISGLRMATLFVGNDIEKAWPQLNKKSRYHNRFELTTFVMQAKHIMYSAEADLESLIQADLKASYDQLSKLPETVKALDKIEINAVIAKLSNLSNMGIMGNSTRETLPIVWTQPGLEKRLRLKDWSTFYSVESDLTDLMDLAAAAPK